MSTICNQMCAMDQHHRFLASLLEIFTWEFGFRRIQCVGSSFEWMFPERNPENSAQGPSTLLFTNNKSTFLLLGGYTAKTNFEPVFIFFLGVQSSARSKILVSVWELDSDGS